jgi:hypothetical protein
MHSQDARDDKRTQQIAKIINATTQLYWEPFG